MTGTIDWNTVWTQKYHANLDSRGAGECASMWNSKEQALKFLKMSQENPERIEKMLERFTLTPGTRVLDIGAGPGTVAIPLSGRAAEVTAIEPALGMVQVMQDRMEEHGIQNLHIIQKRWEDVDILTDLHPPYDLVIAPYSLGMPDIRAAIEKIQAVSSGEIWLFWFAGTTSWEEQMKKIWPRIHKNPYSAPPKSDILFNILYQMHIYPNIEFTDMEHVREYSSMAEAVEETRRQLSCSDEHDDIIRSFLLQELIEENDRFIQRGMTKRVSFTWKSS